MPLALNIVIPMAGRGSRFQKQNYKLPKPLIEVHGFPMIRWVIENLKPTIPHRFIFLCLKEHIDLYQIDRKLNSWAPGCEIISVDQVTEGAACTVLLAKNFINNQSPLMIANSDQWIHCDINTYLKYQSEHNLAGLIMTMKDSDPKWSFVRIGKNNLVIEVLEKQPISDEATVGIYNFRHGVEFVQSAEAMIKLKLKVNNEYYVAPVYNQLIKSGAKVGFYNIGKLDITMFGLGTPEDLNRFLLNPISLKAIDQLR